MAHTHGYPTKNGRLHFKELTDFFLSADFPQCYNSRRTVSVHCDKRDYPDEVKRHRSYFSTSMTDKDGKYDHARYCVLIKRTSADKNGINIFYDNPLTGEEECRNVNPMMYVYEFTDNDACYPEGD